MSEKDQILQNLHSDIKDLHLRLEHSTSEKAAAIAQYEDNEKYWKGKLGKLDRDNEQLFDLNT